MSRLTKEKLNKFKKDIQNNYHKHDSNYFAEKHGVTQERVYYWASKLNISRENRFTDKLKQEIFDDYWVEGKPTLEIYKKYNIRYKRLKEIVEEKGEKLRDRISARNLLPLNEDYFEKIDSPQKAYWLGFLYADGNISNQNVLQLRLQSRDRYIIENFAKDLESGHKIYTENNGATTGIGIRNSKITQDLKDKGVTQNKTFKLIFPEAGDFIPKKYFDNFLIGFFDGDGCFKISKNKYKKTFYPYFLFGATGVESFIKGLDKYLELEYGIKSTVRKEKRNKESLIYNIYFLKNRENFKQNSNFLKKGYKGLETYLVRKKSVVDSYLENKGYLKPIKHD